jgi:hypothetical protein
MRRNHERGEFAGNSSQVNDENVIGFAKSPRAVEVVKRQLVLRARLKLARGVKHAELFLKDSSESTRNLNDPPDAWR